ncbi:MAG: hypothetical protein E7036_02630 [Opitutales bacterium]|nr:hypothetical protein [Opitutales bacterium]
MRKYTHILATITFLCASAFANERIETDKVAVEFDDNGNLVSLKNKVDNVDYAGGQGLWRLIYQQDKLLEEPIESEEVKATLKKISDKQININYDGEFPVEVKCEVKEDEVYFSAKITNNSKDKLLREFQFPMIKNANLSKDVKYVHSGGGGGIIPNFYANVISAQTQYKSQDNKAVERYTPYPMNRTMNFYTLMNDNYSLLFASLDPQFELTLHLARYRKVNNVFKYMDIAMVKYPFIKTGESYQTAPFLISPHSGDWRVSAKKYAKGATWFKAPKAPDFIKKMNGWQRMILRHQYGTILFPYAKMDNIRKAGMDCGIDTMLMFGWWEEGMDAGYPLYTPEKTQGGDAELKKRIKEFQSKGGKVLMYFNGQLIDMSTDFYKNEGHKLCVKNPSGAPHIEQYPFGGEGTGLRVLGHKMFVTGCHGTKGWEEVLLKKYVDRALALGVDGIFLDQLGFGSRICWDKSHGHKVPCTNMMWYKQEMLRKIRAYIKEKAPNVAFGVEYVGDATSQHVDFVHICGFDYNTYKGKGGKPEFKYIPLFRYAFPDITLSDRTIRDDSDIERRLNTCLMWGLVSDIEIYRCRKTIDETPHYKQYMAKANVLRDKYRRLILEGTYSDRDYAKVSNGKMHYTTFKNGDEIAVFVTNNWQKNLKGKVEIDGYKLTEIDGLGKYKATADGDDAKVELGLYDLALLVFKKK